MPYRRWLGLGVLVLLMAAVLVGDGVSHGWWNGRDDRRILVVSPESMALLTISPRRGIVNELVIHKTVKLWIPGGLGWYQTDRIYRLLVQEKKTEMLSQLAFYNFGFLPNEVIMRETVDGWDGWKSLLESSGILNGIRLKIMVDGLLVKDSQLTSDMSPTNPIVSSLARDFADTQLLNDESRLTIINASGEDGVAEWLSLRLGWAGMTVIETQTQDIQPDCQLVVTSEKENGVTMTWLKDQYAGCQVVYDPTVISGEIELVIGEKLTKMLEYRNYVRSF